MAEDWAARGRARHVGLSQEELVETLMHVAIYAGVPTGVNALKVAAAVFGNR